jgi:hypothetical protein
MDGGDNAITFETQGVGEVMRILGDSGNLLVGKTNDADSGDGVRIRSDGLLQATRSNADPLSVNRASSDGDIAVFRKDGSAVGSIGTLGGVAYMNSGDVGFSLDWGSDQIKPRQANGANRDAAIDLGASASRFKDLYLSGGVYLGGTGSANKLDDYEEGTWTPTMAGYSGVTYGNTRVGYYTRVGRMVMANFEMEITSIGTYTGNSHIGGFPFSAGISNTAACGVQLTVMTALNETRDEHYGALYNGGSGFFIYNRNGTARNGNVHQAGKYAGTLIYTGY